MGQKVNPIGMRIGINKTWDSCWVNKRGYAACLHQDIAIRNYIYKKLGQAGISRIVIERPDKKACLTIHAARPGILIGKKGVDIENLKQMITKMTNSEVSINIVEVRKPEVDAKLIADGVAQQIENRTPFKRAMKRAMQSAMRLGALGIRINCSGRLNGAEIARMEWFREGQVPLHTLKADVDFGLGVAKTTYGVCGVKVWVYKGNVKGYSQNTAEKGHDSHGKVPGSGWQEKDKRNAKKSHVPESRRNQQGGATETIEHSEVLCSAPVVENVEMQSSVVDKV
jgi:small subunit ribosomal protein S3